MSTDTKTRLNVLCQKLFKQPPVFSTEKFGENAFASSVAIAGGEEAVRWPPSAARFQKQKDAEQAVALMALIHMDGTDEHVVYHALCSLCQTPGNGGFVQSAIRKHCAFEIDKKNVNRVLYAMERAQLASSHAGPCGKPSWRMAAPNAHHALPPPQRYVVEMKNDIVLLDGDHGSPEGSAWRMRGAETIAFVGHAFSGSVDADEIVRATMPVREASDMLAAFWAGNNIDMLRTRSKVFIASNDGGWMQLAHTLRTQGVDSVYCRTDGSGAHVW